MARVLLFLIWPVGMAVIFGVAALLARRAHAAPAGPRLGRLPWLGYRAALDDADGSSTFRGAVRKALVFLAVIVVGGAVIFGIMALLGQLVLHGGPTIDKPIYHWVAVHRIHTWKGLMASLTKIGNTWSTRMAVVSAAVCLAVTWRRYKWLPALAFLDAVAAAALPDARHPRGRPPGRAARIPAWRLPLGRLRAHRGVLRADRLLPLA